MHTLELASWECQANWNSQSTISVTTKNIAVQFGKKSENFIFFLVVLILLSSRVRTTIGYSRHFFFLFFVVGWKKAHTVYIHKWVRHKIYCSLRSAAYLKYSLIISQSFSSDKLKVAQSSKQKFSLFKKNVCTDDLPLSSSSPSTYIYYRATQFPPV